GYASRTVDGETWVSNAIHHFRPDGGSPIRTREVVSNQACNGCHGTLSAHGGSRQDVTLCITCHNPGSSDPDTGNTVDFKEMIHKIHRGANLFQKPYQIIGFGGSVHDYSDVVFPGQLSRCTMCHQGQDADRHLTRPTSKACLSCHDDVA